MNVFMFIWILNILRGDVDGIDVNKRSDDLTYLNLSYDLLRMLNSVLLTYGRFNKVFLPYLSHQHDSTVPYRTVS